MCWGRGRRRRRRRRLWGGEREGEVVGGEEGGGVGFDGLRRVGEVGIVLDVWVV